MKSEAANGYNEKVLKGSFQTVTKCMKVTNDRYGKDKFSFVFIRKKSLKVKLSIL